MTFGAMFAGALLVVMLVTFGRPKNDKLVGIAGAGINLLLDVRSSTENVATLRNSFMHAADAAIATLGSFNFTRAAVSIAYEMDRPPLIEEVVRNVT